MNSAKDPRFCSPSSVVSCRAVKQILTDPVQRWRKPKMPASEKRFLVEPNDSAASPSRDPKSKISLRLGRLTWPSTGRFKSHHPLGQTSLATRIALWILA